MIIATAPNPPTSAVVALSGDQAQMTCTITGEAAVRHSVTWFIDGTEFVAGAAVLEPGTLTATLLFANVNVAYTSLNVSHVTLRNLVELLSLFAHVS